MFKDLGGYSLASLRNSEDESSSGPKKKKVVKKVSKGFVRPEGGKAQIVWDGIRFVQLAAYLAKQARERFKPLKELAEKCADLSVSEPERRKLNKQIQVEADKFSGFVIEELKLDGASIFDGRYQKQPCVFHLKEDGSEPINIEIPNLTKQGLRLHLARMDTLVNSRKGIKVISEAAEKIETAINTIESKRKLLDMGRVKVGIGVPDFVKLEIHGEQEEEEVVEELAEDPVIDIPKQFLVIKKAQERAARAKGRMHSLLVNIRA